MTFLEEVARALVAAGRSVEIDPEMSTIGITSASVDKVLAVVRPHARGVTFYVVREGLVPSASLGAVSELTVRATADLLDASLELDLATGAVAARFPVVLGELASRGALRAHGHRTSLEHRFEEVGEGSGVVELKLVRATGNPEPRGFAREPQRDFSPRGDRARGDGERLVDELGPVEPGRGLDDEGSSDAAHGRKRTSPRWVP